MIPAKIKELIDRARALQLQIKQDEDELKKIKKELILEAASKPTSHVPAGDIDGTKWVQRGTKTELEIIFPADALRDQILASSADWVKIRKILGEKSPGYLFDQVQAWAPKPDFRKIVADHFGKKLADRLINLCTKNSDPKVVMKEIAEEPK